MPSNLPSSFASAAAGQNANRDIRGGRGEWSRRDGRLANGTLTFRRSSTTPTGHASQSSSHEEHSQLPIENASAADPAGHVVGPSRYTKDELLEIFQCQQPAASDASRLFITGWDPTSMNNGNQRGWIKGAENNGMMDPNACWDPNAESSPLNFRELSAEEKEAFAADINSPLKPPPTQSKEGHQGSVNDRKNSISQSTANAHSTNSPSSTARNGPRRREPLDANAAGGGGASLQTAVATRFSRDDTTSWLARKGAEAKDSDSATTEGDQPTRDATSKFSTGSSLRSAITGNPNLGNRWPASSSSSLANRGFGNFSLSSSVGEKRTGPGTTGGSRLAHLMSRDNQESKPTKPSEGHSPAQQSWRTRPRTDTDPFGNDEPSGGAMLGGAQDTSSAGQANIKSIGILGTPSKMPGPDLGISAPNAGGRLEEYGPISPSETNPFRSPAAERRHQETTEPTGVDRQQHSIGQHGQPPSAGLGPFGRTLGVSTFEGSDRSQTSSTGPKVHHLSTLSGWPAPSMPPIGTPDRERPNLGNAFGSSLFTSMGDLQSPGLSGLGNVFSSAGAASLGTASISRGSKLGSLFPPAMQAQMQSHEHERVQSDGLSEPRQGHSLGPIGRGNLPTRDTESPMRPNRGVFEELFPSSDTGRSLATFASAEPPQTSSNPASVQPFTPTNSGLPFGVNAPMNEPSSAQIRTMVMPDRMRWVYLDPQGHVQGPFTGLEMSDWYKANFFTPDLRVKKVEDPDFEPLGQLIRRIGNSREPFLVPQIGIPHGPPAQNGPFTPTSASGGVVPPLSGVFPSFGRTLTAEEQNNLERRKQEEQYLMAQQRDFMMRQQAMTKFQMQRPGLQHHGSAHSLQSQPSFSNITSPIGTGPQQQQQPPPIGSLPPGVFADPTTAAGSSGLQPAPGGADAFRLDSFANLTLAERQILASMQSGSGALDVGQHQQAVAGSFPGMMNLRSALPQADQLLADPEGFRERLQEFEDLRAQQDAAHIASLQENERSPATADVIAPVQGVPLAPQRDVTPPAPRKASKSDERRAEDGSLSLTQQVQKTQVEAAAASQPSDPKLPMPFPPPSTPLPAPTAQRARYNLPDEYSWSQGGSPDPSQPSSIAPWAKEPSQEGQRGPSLKEIQDAEARKAAKVEEAAASLRKAAFDQAAELQREREKQAAASTAAGLPPTSTWGHSSPVPSATSWAKPQASKGPATASTSSSTPASRKTLAEIQREEESRKQRAKDSAAPASHAGGSAKSYANLAGKPQQLNSTPASSAATSGWATVGAGGKVKVPTGPAAQARSVSAANAKPPVPAARNTAKPPATSSASGRSEGPAAAREEFSKWTRRELSRGLTNVTDISDFQADLDALPLDTGVIADAVYANSKTMDGRHFAEEYVRRKRLAEKGIVEKQPPLDAGKGTGPASGWSEVAKRSGSTQPKENEGSSMQGAGFKVVPSRKKGKK